MDYLQFSMHLNLGKSFPVLKFKPNILQPLRLDFNDLKNAKFDVNKPISSWDDIVEIDYLLGTSIEGCKRAIERYILGVKGGLMSDIRVVKEQLKAELEKMVQMLEKLDMQNFQKDISDLFRGSDGIYQLFRYVWQADLLQLMLKLKSSFELKNDKENDAEIAILCRKSETFYDQFQQILGKEAKFVLKEFTQEMYIMPEHWGIKLIRKNLCNFDEQIALIINSEQSEQTKRNKILEKYISKEEDLQAYKEISRVLFYLDIESQLYPYLTILKSILLNKVSGIFNGDYDTWQLVYEACLKIYSRKEQARGKNGIQIDQIIQHQKQDTEFTNFLLKSDPQNVSLGTINFYFKNCKKSTQNTLRPIIMNKINNLLAKNNGFAEYEDIFEYLDTEAMMGERAQIIQWVRESWERIIDNGIRQEDYYIACKNAPDLIQYTLKKLEYFAKLFSDTLLQKMLNYLRLPTEKSCKNLVFLIYSFINSVLIQSYQEQIDFYEDTKTEDLKFEGLIKQIIIILKNRHGLQVHEDAIAIVADWDKKKKKKKGNDSENSQDQQKQEEIQENEENDEDMALQISNLMLISGKDCDFKLEYFCKTEERRQLVANQLTRVFKILSDALFEQRRSIQRFLQLKHSRALTPSQLTYAKSFLAIKGFKDKLLHQNIMNVGLKINPTICFGEISLLAVQFLTFSAPVMVDQPLPVGSELQYATIQPFDICDIASGEEPIECMKLIYKKVPEFEQDLLDFECLEKMPLPLLKSLGSLSACRRDLVSYFVEMEEEVSIIMLDKFEEFRKYLFYAELMTKVFNKLNEKSQKGIKEIKVIFASMQKTCLKIWKTLRNRIISSEIFSLCRQNVEFQQKLMELRDKNSAKDLQKQSLSFYQSTFNKLMRNIKLPYLDSILSHNNYMTKTCHDLICNIGKVISPQNFNQLYHKLFNPLQILVMDQVTDGNGEFVRNYEFIGELVKFLTFIEFTCCNQEANQNRDKEEHKEWSSQWRKTCKVLIDNLLIKIEQFNNSSKKENVNLIQNTAKNLWVNLFMVHLKAETTKILIPFLVKDPLKNPVDNPKTYKAQLEQTFSIFTSLCQIIESITQGQQQHLMTFLQIFQNFDSSSNKNIQSHAKLSEFLYKAIESLLELVFKGIRVRSYHFYKFIRSYLKLTKQKENYVFFNSVIAFYLQNLMTQIVPQFVLPNSVLEFCDQNMNTGLKLQSNTSRESPNKEVLINESNLKKSVNKIRFSKFVRFEPKFDETAQRVCAISMFINLFCRLNFKTLTQGIQKIWQGEKMHLLYIEYLQKMTVLLTKQKGKTDQKLYDIINVDCFGNLTIILRSQTHTHSIKGEKHHHSTKSDAEYNRKIIYQLLKLTQYVTKSQIKQKIINSLTIPIQKIKNEIKNTSTPTETIDFISQSIQKLGIFTSTTQQFVQLVSVPTKQCPQILDMVLTCFNTKLARGVSSNVHIANLLYIVADSDLKLRVLEQNMEVLERRMPRKDIRMTLQKLERKDEMSAKGKGRRPSINKKQRPTGGDSTIINETWTNISKNSHLLISQIVQNFLQSYSQCQHDKTVSSLFNNLKILSLVTINNPEVVSYLLERDANGGKSVYDVMMECVGTCLPVFAELYMAFVKTNYGFYKTELNGEEIVLPNSVSIDIKIKADILSKVKALLVEQPSTLEIKKILKCLQFLTALSKSNIKPFLRFYKFGSIVNRVYSQYQAKRQLQFNKKLIQILKLGVNKLNEQALSEGKPLHGNYLELLSLYQEVLGIVLKDNDLAWMKLNLDLELKDLQKIRKCDPQSIKREIIQTSTEPLQKSIVQDTTISTEQISRQAHSFIRYSFESEVIGQDIYGIIHKFSLNQPTDSITQQILRNMMDYSAKHSSWEGLAEDDSVLLHYPTNRSGQGSGFGVPSLSDNDSEQTNPRDNITEETESPVGEVERSAIAQQYDNIIENEEEQPIPSILEKPKSTRSRFYMEQGYDGDCIVEQNSGSRDEIIEQDGVIEEDGIIQDDCFIIADELKECMSETSLKFLSQHEVKYMEEETSVANHPQIEPTKQHLLQLYEQSVINPEARKQLLQAITFANVLELQKFISNQAVDEEIEMLVVRELWGRGVVPSATSISKSSRYYGNLVGPTRNVGQCFNVYINEAVAYKKMYEGYSREMVINPTQQYIPIISRICLEKVIISNFMSSYDSKNKQKSVKIWKNVNKMCLKPQNMHSLLQITLKYLSLTDSQIVAEFTKLNGGGEIVATVEFKKCLIDDVLCGCIRDKIGLRLLFTAGWDCQKHQLCYNQESEVGEKGLQIVVPVLQYILKESCLIEQTLIKKAESDSLTDSSSSFIHTLWQYFQSCDEFKAHSKLDQKNRESLYPYYQLQETLKISENVIRKIVDRLFSARLVIGCAGKDKQKSKNNGSGMEQLFMILVYLDPNCFEAYFKTVVDKISDKLSEIVKKQYKILTNFQLSWKARSTQTDGQMQKQEKYWSLRQAKKSTSGHEESLEYFRNILVDFSVNLLQKFKKLRFNYHCGKSYREWKLEIEILKEKLLTYGSVQGLVQLEQKQRQLQTWKRSQSNQIIHQQILPIIQDNSQDFMKVLMEIEEFVSEFLDTFELQDNKQKIVIYDSCAKLYEILLTADIMTHEQKLTYHSMSKLKTIQTIESTRNVNYRKSSLLSNRKPSARISINSCMLKVETLLRKIGPSCTFLSNYLGNEEAIKELHAKYSDVNKRLKVLWGNQTNNHVTNRTQQQKTIKCRRTHILQDTLSQIDEDFINLPVKIAFEGQIGIDYGGVTREWITLFMKEVINPGIGLFSLSANGLTFQPNKNSYLIPNHLRYFRKIGILVGKAMKENWLLEINLTKSFLKHLLGSTLYVEDLEDIDPDTAKSLKWILQNNIGFDDDLGLNFTYQVDRLGKKETIELIPNGADITVTEDNKKQYVKLLANMRMTEEIRQQSKAFMSGLESVISYSTLCIFSYKEISLYLAGMPTIDIKQMQATARYQNLTPQSQQITWFWAILAQWNQQQLANFLFFLTGSFKVPYGGFKQHPIGFNKMASCTDYLPVAHTCFSVIDISAYTSMDKMEKLLKKSIKEGKGFSVS